MKPASAPAAVAELGDEGIEPLGNHGNVLCRLFYRQTCGTSPGVRLVRLELTRPKAHALNVVRRPNCATVASIAQVRLERTNARV